MKRIPFLAASLILAFLSLHPTLTFSEESKPIQLLKPQTEDGG